MTTDRSHSGNACSGFQGRADGYRGIWSFKGSTLSHDEYVYTHYSGGFATVFAKHIPLAVYSETANKTFFCYGGTQKHQRSILIMASCYDHTTHTVPKPTILMDKETDDGHDNPVIMLDDNGYVFIFASAHGTSRPAYVFKSRDPHSVDSFDLLRTTNFSYPQPWYLPGRGFLFLHTRYLGGRFLHSSTSRDGVTWSEPRLLAKVAHGHYQISWPCKSRVGTAFNAHPDPKGCESRTNLYYMQTDDFGETWTSAGGEPVTIPLVHMANEALVHDYQSEGLLVYMKQIAYDRQERPIILYLTSPGVESGPENHPRIWRTARWTGSDWEILRACVSDNNYDYGAFHVEHDGTWRIIAPTEPGPQPYNCGGEIAVWLSSDQGRNWTKQRLVTQGGIHNHNYVRKTVNAHPDFYAFWADGHARQQSDSRLYFCDRTGTNVYRLPASVEGESVAPERVTF